jgi:hypothetical protein
MPWRIQPKTDDIVPVDFVFGRELRNQAAQFGLKRQEIGDSRKVIQ